MRIVTGAFICALCLCDAAHSQSITLENAARAEEIIQAAYAAHGGELGLSNLETLYIEQSQVSYSIDQSRGVEPPWDRGHAEGYNAIDLVNERFTNRFEGATGGFENHTSTMINGADSYQINYRAGTVAQIADPDFDAAAAAYMRVTPALLVRELEERSANAHYLGETTIGDFDCDVIGFSMSVGPAINLYFDKESHLLRRSERIFAGAGMVEYEFDNYETIDGIPINRSFRLFLEGNPNLVREFGSVQINQSIDELFTVQRGLRRVEAQRNDPLTRQEIGDGVWLIGGNGTYALFVDMDDYIFAAGATAGIEERVRLLREVVGEKSIRYAMMTHHHFDHVMGIGDYEQEGATIIAASAHEAVARRAAENGVSLDVITVDSEYTLESDNQVVRIIDFGPTAHTEHLLVAYLPKEQMLFEGDHFAMPVTGPVPPAVSSTRSFAEILAGSGLTVEKFVSEHSPNIGTPADLQESLEKALYQAQN